MTAMEKIAAQRVVPVIRCVNAEDAVLTARAANAEGMQVVELTLTTPDVHEALRELRGDGLTLGLGSLLSEGDVAAAVEAGAESSSPSARSPVSSPPRTRPRSTPCRAP
jgi:2-dehydro-3-deoxyphosphogluconate aldolase / (4S)-4-hydroxy-2-oxoglutarate aldolase